MSDWFARTQRLLPHHALSRLGGRVASARAGWVRRPIIQTFARVYDVDMSEAAQPDLNAYGSFNEFFTRALRPECRPLDEDPLALLSPADGTVSQVGSLSGDRLLQAKGTTYRLGALLESQRRAAGGTVVPDAQSFHGGSFATIYLAPRDYHRVHMPTAGTLTQTTAIPGDLFSVNARTEAAITDLFCRNERLVCRFDTNAGAMLVILVGAMIVASIETVWDGAHSPYQRLEHRQHALPLDRGQELGRFLLGSTVIVCCQPDRVQWRDDLAPGIRVRMGEGLGRFLH